MQSQRLHSLLHLRLIAVHTQRSVALQGWENRVTYMRIIENNKS
jgi:hypothetical protein